ncbi:hypothetical protein N656DRAFT_125240 [Canariomyces notabilis]|uniref:Uncharacterized protein n=1 Tax=Canariomyces notabilis TaxID=2074819 RepID=A0AAN6TCJ3_9PEZI|nr:hypothetical protein N656DRAFT_125240 [Canariomyces arenarius]
MANPIAVNEKGLTVLYEGPNPTIDIVFVHGFTGHPEDTWKLKGAKTKRHAPDDGFTDSTRRSKISRVFSRQGRSTPALSPAQSSSTPTIDEAHGGSFAEFKGHRAKDVFWPADLAPKSIPDSRILTYGYDTRIRHWAQGQVSRKSVYDHAWDLLCSLEAFRRGSS